MYIKSLTIKNLRCFREARLELQYPGKATRAPLQHPNINLLVGNNGAGKSSVLRALALAALAPIMPQSGFLPYRLVRRAAGEEPAEAEISAEAIAHKQDGAQAAALASLAANVRIERRGDHEYLAQLPFAPQWEEMFNDKSPAFLVVGYGATRRVEQMRNYDESARRKARLLRYERVAGLFEGHIALTPLAAWLPNFAGKNPGRHKQVVNLINRLLPADAAFAGKYEEGEYFFELKGEAMPFGALSDGYRAYIGWIADLLYHVCMGAPSGAKLVENRGVVLVDEIDLHLHPEWQRSIITRISQALPNLQFVFSTHSPIVAGSLESENIFVMDSDAHGVAVVKQFAERIYGLPAEEVLLSSYFNLKTTRAEPVVDELQELSVKAGEGDLSAALAFMRKLAGRNGAGATTESQAAPPKKAAAKKPANKAAKTAGRKSAKRK